MHFFAIFSGRFDMLVSMLDKELKRLSVLKKSGDQRITQSQAAQLLFQNVRSDTIAKYKAQGPAVISTCCTWPNQQISRLPEELRPRL